MAQDKTSHDSRFHQPVLKPSLQDLKALERLSTETQLSRIRHTCDIALVLVMLHAGFVM